MCSFWCWLLRSDHHNGEVETTSTKFAAESGEERGDKEETFVKSKTEWNELADSQPSLHSKHVLGTLCAKDCVWRCRNCTQSCCPKEAVVDMADL